MIKRIFKFKVVYETLNFILKQIISRVSFISMNLFLLIFSGYSLVYLFNFIHKSSQMTHEDIENVNKTLNSIAGILVGLGVVMECRESICKMIKLEVGHLQEFLNEIAEFNGIGLLILGLFMEIATSIIEAPNDLVNTQGIEVYLYYFCFVMISISALVEIDFIKDYIKSYFKKPEELVEVSH